MSFIRPPATPHPPRPLVPATDVRLAFVGCGAVVEKLHAKAAEYLIGRYPLRVAAALDPDPGRRDAMARRFPGCTPVESLAELPPEVNLAIVASPAGFHAAQAIDLVQRGIHVLCEKPMAINSVECDRMIEAARNAKRLLAVGHMRRFFPVSKYVRRLVAEQPFGRAVSFRIVEGIRYQWAAVSDNNFRRESGGGVLRDVGVHTLDLILWWIGEPRGVDYRDDAMGGVEANARISLSFANGVEGEVVLSRDWNLREQFFIQFENGWISFRPYDTNHLEVSLSPGIVLKSTLHSELAAGNRRIAGPLGATFQQAFIDQLLNLMQAIVAGEELLVPGEEGAGAVRLIENCLRSRRLIEMPWMSELELSTARTLA